MNVLAFYIVKEVLKGSSIALMLLLTLFNLFTFSDELKDLGKGSYGLKEILQYLALTSPRVFYELIPSSALLGSLFVVGAMANNREIVAMRAAGLSIFWIIRSVMVAGIILVFTAVLVGEFIAPEAERAAQLIKTKSKNNEIVMSSKYGLWLREKNKFINVRKMHEKGVLSEIYAYEVNEKGNLVSMNYIEQATFLGNGLWSMDNINQMKVLSQPIRINKKDQMNWETSINPDLLNVVVIKPENMSLYDLYMYISFLKDNNQKTESFELAFWSRLINPFITFVMLMVSIPFVIGIKRGIGTGGRVMIGIVFGMTFNIFDKIAGHVGLVYGYNPMVMAILPSAIVFCFAVYAVSRVR
ncbi:MAG: LPS export ABC transporter permease LptG [Methylococcales bacterium]|nr:LPS export ABC transporter permease LptG [Methylococcales bacterium]